MFKAIILFFPLLFTSQFAYSNLVEFTISNGTEENSWNTKVSPIEVVVGDTLRIHNEDDVDHRFHTFGAPCDHGPVIPAGEYRDHKIHSTYKLENGPLYDHIYGSGSQVWIESVPNFEF